MDQNQLQSILAHLTALRHRALVLSLCTGLVLALAVGLALSLLWVLLEALLFLAPAWRTSLGALGLLGAGSVLALFLKKHLIQVFTH